MTRRLAALLLLCACPEKAAPPAAAPAPPKGPPAECEFFGEVRLAGELKPARIVFAVTKSPCTADAADPGVLMHAEAQPGKLFHEFFFPQGSTGYACAYALDDKGQVIGHAAHAQGQLSFQGTGEVEFRNVTLELAAVPARPAPPGL